MAFGKVRGHAKPNWESRDTRDIYIPTPRGVLAVYCIL